VPADSEYVSVLRAVCGHLAPLLGYTPPEVADLRLAVGEACGLLLRNCVRPVRPEGRAQQDDLAATFAVDPRGLSITLETEAVASVAPSNEDFGWAILTALVDDFIWCVEGSTARVELRRQHAAGREKWTRSSN